jgi:hypothetical protein
MRRVRRNSYNNYALSPAASNRTAKINMPFAESRKVAHVPGSWMLYGGGTGRSAPANPGLPQREPAKAYA